MCIYILKHQKTKYVYTYIYNHILMLLLTKIHSQKQKKQVSRELISKTFSASKVLVFSANLSLTSIPFRFQDGPTNHKPKEQSGKAECGGCKSGVWDNMAKHWNSKCRSVMRTLWSISDLIMVHWRIAQKDRKSGRWPQLKRVPQKKEKARAPLMHTATHFEIQGSVHNTQTWV